MLEFQIPIHFEDISLSSSDKYSIKKIIDKFIKNVYIFLEHYISYQHSSSTTKESSKSTSENNNETASITSKKKSTKKKNSSVLDTWEQEEQKEAILTSIINCLELNLSTLWRLDYPEEEFINLLSKIIYAMIEQPANLRSKGVKKLIFEVLSILILRYNHSFNFTSKIIHLLHNHESLPSHCADLYEFIYDYQQQQQKHQQQQQQQNIYSQSTNQQQKNQTTFLISDIIREIGKQKEQRDTSGFKNLAKFLSELTDRLPKIVLPFVSLLLAHLDSESYLMRNAVTESIGFLIGKALNKVESNNKDKKSEQEEEEEVENQKKNESDQSELLHILFERCRDINGYCRSSVLKTLSLLVNNNWVPKESYIQLTKIAIERVSDKNSLVRKRAILLLSDILESNPYSPHLPTLLFKDKKEKLASFIKLSFYNLKKKKELLKKSKKLKNNNNNNNEDDLLNSQQVPDDNMEFEQQQQQQKEEEEKKEKEEEDGEEEEEEEEITEKQIFEDIKLNKEQFFDLISMLVPFSGIKEFSPHRLPLYLEHLNKYLDSSCKFIKIINSTIDTMCQLMGSVNPSDILESVHFIQVAHKYQIDKSKEAITKMLALIWNKEQSIKESTIRSFHELLIKDTREKVKSTLKSSYYIAKNLIDLTTTATLGEITSLEELMIEFTKKDLIDQDIIKALWDIFSGKVVNFNKQDSRGALIILSMISNNNSSVVKDKVNLLVSIGLEEQDDEFLPRYTCITLQKLRSKGLKETDQILPRFKNNQSLFERLIYHICSTTTTTTTTNDNIDNDIKNSKWFMFAEQVINTIYILAEQPDLISSEIIKKLSDQVLDENGETNQYCLSKLIFILGHIAIKQLVYVEEIQSEIKRIQYEQSKQSKNNNNNNKKKTDIEKELGTDQAEAEAESEAIQIQAESDILSENNLIGKYSQLVVSICYNYNEIFSNEQFPNQLLQTSAVLTLSKFMCVDSNFCESNLQLLFTLLEKSSIEVIRSNIIIGLGDLAFRFPNLVEPWTSKIYSRLRDPNADARKNSLMVLTHLILNDMIKVKGQISEMAICLEDSDIRISNIAKLFFSTLASKGNNLYNSLPDIIGKITPASTVTSNLNNISKDSIKNILKYLFSFIEKDKQSETLIDKLLQRFKTSKSISESQNISFCLQLLNYNDKSLKKLIEHFKLYQDKLNDNEIYNNLMISISKTKKQPNLTKTSEIKQLVDEIEKKINTARSQLTLGETVQLVQETDGNSSGTSSTTTTSQSIQKPPLKPSKKAPAKKRAPSRKKYQSSEEEESEESSEEEDEESGDDEDRMIITPKKPISKPMVPSRKRQPVQKKKSSESEQSSESDQSSEISDIDRMDITPKKPPKKPQPKQSKKKPASRLKKAISQSESESESDIDSESSNSSSFDNISE
ncbi:condensin-2 complex subunit D3 [Dictyostelium discoideum AX4]|uniref:Condensin-2 complex subunit D3 n=1 Tax=Dictyostelium discoideum TaxID=44689 RepID=Q54B17_DICDI|nr:condensin-2 complex subunit D3 [Dictyostelium discoideum AX4]EAL60491.1 condensin-2 complex subunit D3 [Dictyostelium discoideum AX4]|eukprot:XP_628899.1 condensin-2 complex subunit D3 [Dictyostelium discoideum AX4]